MTNALCSQIEMQCNLLFNDHTMPSFLKSPQTLVEVESSEHTFVSNILKIQYYGLWIVQSYIIAKQQHLNTKQNSDLLVILKQYNTLFDVSLGV
jgi:hypothetical protein